MAKWTKSNEASRGYTSYTSTEAVGVILLSKPAFNGTHPDSFELDAPAPVAGTKSAKVAGPKRTKEEIKAALQVEKARFAALTPEEKNAELRDKAAKRREAAALALKKAEERAAKLAA